MNKSNKKEVKKTKKMISNVKIKQTKNNNKIDNNKIDNNNIFNKLTNVEKKPKVKILVTFE